MNPAFGTLMGEPLPFGNVKSKNTLYRGQVELTDGSIKSCLLKNIDRIEIVNELVSNLIGQKLGLPIPPAVLTFVPETFNDKKQFDKGHKITGGVLVFASVDAQTPNLLQRLQTTHPMGQKIIEQYLRSWSKKSSLYGFDTWVANVDRNIQNLLFGSKNEIWLIDHGQCFTKEDWCPGDLVPGVRYFNKLKLWYSKILDVPLRKKTSGELQQIQDEIAKLDIASILSDSLATGLTEASEQVALQDFLAARISRVAADGAAALQP